MRRNMNPGFIFTPAIVRDLMDIEAARQAVQLPRHQRRRDLVPDLVTWY